MESVGEVAGEDVWAPVGVDEAAFDAGRLGPYRLGPSARRTQFGEVILALGDRSDGILEIDLLDALLGTPLADPESGLMADISAIAALRHRCLIPMVGAGVQDGVPYVVRPHRLGRTLDVLLELGPLTVDVAAVVLYAVSETLSFLAESGPMPDACAMGGVGPRDVFLGYDGSIALVSLGLKRARNHEGDAASADLASCFTLARELETGLPAVVAGATAFSEVSRAVRRRFGAACARSALHVGAAMRRAFPAEIAADRAFFGLPPLQ